MHADTIGGSQLRGHGRVFQIHAVIARFRSLSGVRKTRAISRLGFLWISGFQGNILTADRHEKYVAEIAMSRAGEVRMREPEDGRVLVAISGCPLVALFKWPDLRIGRELHH